MNFSHGRFRAAAVFAALLALILAGCSHQETETPPTPTPAPAVAPLTTDKSVGEVTIYKRGAGTTSPGDDPLAGLTAETVQIPVDSKSPARDALDYLVTAKDSPMPRGTRLLGVSVDDAKATATVNLSHQFIDSAKGETDAQIALNSVLATMGQFSNVNQVQFEVEGKTDGEIGGAVALADPMPVIRPDQKVAGKP